MKVDISATPALRSICFIGFLGMTAQLLLLWEPNFAVQIVEATWDKAIHGLYFGTMAFLLWIATGKRWPFAVWAVVAHGWVSDDAMITLRYASNLVKRRLRRPRSERSSCVSRSS